MITGNSSAAADGFDRSQRSAPVSTVVGMDQIVPKAALPTQAMRRPPQQQRAALRCPRCDSTNTKFCYYNNYSRSQPRHFCRACRRHWTNGGTLRNVPFGGRRKTKRPKPFRRPAPPKSTTCADDDTEVTIPIPAATAVSPQPSQQVLPPPPFVGHQLLRMPPITSSDYIYGDNGENDGSFYPSAFLPLPLAPVFGGDLPVSHGAGAGRAYTTHSFRSSFPSSLLSFAPVDDALELDDAGISMAVPWELLPPSSSGSCPGADSAVTTGGGPTIQEPCSPSPGYWSSCWDDLASFLPPDDPSQATVPPLPPPQDRLQLP